MRRGPVSAPGSPERGAALLSVLLLVAVMAVIAAVMLERLNLAVRLAGNAQAMTQARLTATSAEAVAMARIKALVDADPDRTVDRLGLLGRTLPFTVGTTTVGVRIEDAGNCFNVNSLVQQGSDGVHALRPAALQQLRALMAGLGLSEGEAFPLTDAMVDWMDSDDAPLPNGAEDGTYRALPVPYRTPGRPIADLTELRAVRGMTPQIYVRLRPWLCVLPAEDLSPVNVNTLRPDQARLLAMLAPGTVTIARAQAVIAARPAAGYGATDQVIAALNAGSTGDGPLFGGIPPGQLQLRSRWFRLEQAVEVGPVRLEEQVLIDTGLTPPRIAFRTWGDRDSR